MAATQSKQTKKKAETEEQEFHLEEAFQKIETIIEKLEAEDVSLKESMELYAQGVKLATRCKEELTGIEKEIILIDEKFNVEEE